MLGHHLKQCDELFRQCIRSQMSIWGPDMNTENEHSSSASGEIASECTRLQVAHLQAWQAPGAAAAAGAGQLAQRSVLGALLPESLLYVLTTGGPGAFAAALVADSDTPEVVWTHRMRAQVLVPQVGMAGSIPNNAGLDARYHMTMQLGIPMTCLCTTWHPSWHPVDILASRSWWLIPAKWHPWHCGGQRIAPCATRAVCSMQLTMLVWQ